MVAYKFTKMIHFISYNKIDYITNIVDLLSREIVRLHCVLRSIVSDRDVKFFSYFSKVL